MKNFSYLLIVVFSLSIVVETLAQNTGFTYQAVIRDEKGKIVKRKDVVIRFAIGNDTEYWEERHETTTSKYGLVVLQMGKGFKIGGVAQHFKDIPWLEDNMLITTYVDLGDGFVNVGSQPISSVPLAEYAKNGLTDEQAEKLNRLDKDAEENVQVDWNNNNEESDAFIRNKPFIPQDVKELADSDRLLFKGFFKDLKEVPENLDLDATDDFSGSFQDLEDLPPYLDMDNSDDFDGSFNSLTDLPINLDLDKSDDFSGSFNDLEDLPENLDTDATDDFSGSFNDLTDIPFEITNGDQVDDADSDPENEIQDLRINNDILKITGKVMATEIDLSGYTNTDEQDLSFDGNHITLSGDPDQTVIDLSNYDQDASDDFDGSYNSLTDLPENLDTDATDDFSGSYNDLTDLPENLDTDATDDFSGSYTDLTDVPADIADGDQVDDADADPENEIQDLQINNDVLTITGKAMATEIDLSGYTNTDEQNLSFDGNQITLSGDPDQTVIDLSNYDQDATDDFSGSYTDLTDVPADIADGDQVDDADADPENEIQDLQINNDVLTITGKAMATEIDLSGYTNTDEQNLSFDGNQITLSGDPDQTVIDLSNYDQDATDDFSGSYGDLTDVPAYIADGDQVDDADADPENEIQDLQINNDVLTITGKAMATEIDLSGYTNTDEQNLSFDGNQITLSGDPDQTVIDLSNYDQDATDDFSGSYGDLTDVPAYIADGDQVDDADADPENEIQDLQINNDVLTITGKAMATEIDLSGYTNTDEQNLSFDGNQITLSGDPDQTVIDLSNYDQDATDDFSGSYTDLTDVPADIADGDQVDDADADPENEIQDLQINNDVLTITGKAMATEIDLSGYTNTDEQNLSFDGNQITLSGDPDQTVIDLSNYDQDATDDFSGSYSDLIDVPADIADGDQVDDADADPENEIQDLQINDDILTITGKAMATEIDLSGYTNTDEQDLSFDGNQITLSGDPDQTVIDLSNYDQDASDDFDGSYQPYRFTRKSGYRCDG